MATNSRSKLSSTSDPMLKLTLILSLDKPLNLIQVLTQNPKLTPAYIFSNPSIYPTHKLRN